jgi:trk system potassium uptake protein TrkA
MHVIVVGCGRVGSTIARELTDAGHSVCVIDRRADAFHRLGPDFTGRTLTGVGFDRDVLREAGIDEHAAVMAVTSGDNSNILIARVARETFGVERVVARIYDPKRAAIYSRLGIATVASVAWTAARAVQLVLPDAHATVWTDPTSRHSLVERRVAADEAGRSIAAVDAAGVRVVLVNRNGQASPPTPTMLLQQDDLIHVLVASARLGDVDAALHAERAH